MKLQTAKIFAAARQGAGTAPQPDDTLLITYDGDVCLEHTEATLDNWWNNLKPEEKAEVYELHLEYADIFADGLTHTPTPAARGRELADIILGGVKVEFNSADVGDAFPWSILDEADRVSSSVAAQLTKPLTAPASEVAHASV